MGLAGYAVIAQGNRWGILHDGNVEGDYDVKEAAFEAALAAASLAVRGDTRFTSRSRLR